MVSIDLTHGMQILLILWFQVMYREEGTRENLSKKVTPTYGTNHTSSEYALMAYSGDVYLQKKEYRLSKDVIRHHMEDIMGHSAHMQRFDNVDSFGQ
jgi:hypothetical protein